jgi:hypothetical protein
MPQLPPAAEVIDVLKHAVAPAALAALGVFIILALLAAAASRAAGYEWRRFVPSISALALAASLAAGNHFRGAFPWLPDGKWWHYAWPAIGLAAVVEFIGRLPGVAPSVGNLLRGTAAGVATAFLVPAEWQGAAPWAIPVVAFLLAIQWAIVDSISRQASTPVIPLCLALISFAAAALLIHDKSLGRADIATMAFAGMIVLAILAGATRSEVGGGSALAAVVVPILLLVGYAINYEPEVPPVAYILAALAPSILGLFLLPGLARTNTRWTGGVLKLIAVVISTSIALYLAIRAVPNPFATGAEE